MPSRTSALARGHGSLEIEDALATYVRSAAMPCPYARLATTFVHLQDSIQSTRTRQILRRALSEFWEDDAISILALVPRQQPADHAEARRQAYWIRYHWHHLHLQAEGQIGNGAGQDDHIEAQLRVQYAHWATDASSFLGPRVKVGKADIMMTAFNPLYDEEHPRYAPHAVFPVIRSSDLLTIHERKADLSFAIAVHAKCKILLSMLKCRDGIDVDQMRKEYPAWVDALSYYRDFITTVYTDAQRLDPRTLPQLSTNRAIVRQCLESSQFRGSLVAFRIILQSNRDIPLLNRILAQNPALTVFDVARIVYGDVAGMYVLP